MDKPLVSIVVPAKDSEGTIEACLESIRKQNYPKIEVLVVDKHSKDATREIVKKFGYKVILSNASRSEARNVGAKESKGSFLLFIDSDMELTANVVEECVNKCEDYGFDSTVIFEISIGESFWAKCRALEKRTYIGDPLIEGVRFFRRETFEAIGGYAEDLDAGEDWDLTQRIREAGFRVGLVKSELKHHEPDSISTMVYKKYCYSKSLSRYIERHRMLSARQLSPVRFAFFRHRDLLFREPLHAMGLLLLKTLEGIAVLFGLIFYWRNHSKNRSIFKKAGSSTYAYRVLESRKIRLINRYIPEVKCILDLGCGKGLYIPYLKEKARSVIGLDWSISLLKMAKEFGVHVVCGDANRLPFKSETFDVLWASEIIEHLPSLSVYEEVERVTKKLVIATMPNPYSFNFKADPTHILCYTLSSLKDCVKSRIAWKYVIRGLGVELPALKLPDTLKSLINTLTYAITFYAPILAPTIVVIGDRRATNYEST